MKNSEEYVMQDLKNRGYDVIRTDYIKEPGIPDFKCFNQKTKDEFYLEVKCERGEFIFSQKNKIKTLIENGSVVKYAMIKDNMIEYHKLNSDFTKEFLEKKELPSYIKINILKCLNCGYSWGNRTETPRECPNCKSRKWSQ